MRLWDRRHLLPRVHPTNVLKPLQLPNLGTQGTYLLPRVTLVFVARTPHPVQYPQHIHINVFLPHVELLRRLERSIRCCPFEMVQSGLCGYIVLTKTRQHNVECAFSDPFNQAWGPHGLMNRGSCVSYRRVLGLLLGRIRAF
jgi:hypothetical protein